jgi:hypothetical protein
MSSCMPPTTPARTRSWASCRGSRAGSMAYTRAPSAGYANSGPPLLFDAGDRGRTRGQGGMHSTAGGWKVENWKSWHLAVPLSSVLYISEGPEGGCFGNYSFLIMRSGMWRQSLRRSGGIRRWRQWGRCGRRKRGGGDDGRCRAGDRPFDSRRLSDRHCGNGRPALVDSDD